MSKHWPVVLALFAFTSGNPVRAGQEEATRDALVKCKAIVQIEAKAACYDAVTDALAPAASAGPANTGAAADSSIARREAQLARQLADLKLREATFAAQKKATEDTVSLFGITLSSGPSTPATDTFTVAAAGLPAGTVERNDDGSVDAVTAQVREFSYTNEGKLTVVLDNGQVWRQTGPEEIFLAPNPKHPHKVRIARALMGSFILSLEGTSKAYKVRRVDGVASRRR